MTRHTTAPTLAAFPHTQLDVPAHIERAHFPPRLREASTGQVGTAARVWLASACIPAILALALGLL